MTIDFDAIQAELPPLPEEIKMVVSDMDGTILTPNRELTSATLQMAKVLKERSVPLCLVSARPPEAMIEYIKKLEISGDNAALNGGIIFSQVNMSSSLNHVLSKETLSIIYDMLHAHGIEIWMYRQSSWIVADLASPFVEQERRKTGLTPHQVKDLRQEITNIGKVVGVSNDFDLLQRVETELSVVLKKEASVHRSSDILLGITPALANKGEAVRMLAHSYGVELQNVACLGDAHNDLPMFSVCGLKIVMGQADDDVKAAAQVQTDTNEHDGWAKAVEHYVLPRIAN
ncbi:Cof-type HAD-IIB family hydrolase [Swingsia samuiensis]|uniref:HAD family phosphatase n=1 Tax=Swingsia samuiensis TaxID=1293412 RepID=A0A4Y6UKZ2_9PROT|nr:HAD family hydrolase [Swingsia samuiensis]QDH17308.1 HAD family phosphatase [Swingsia samuiensis]